MTALQLHAGPRARRHLREHGLRPEDVRVIPAAAGGPKGLVLNPLDRFIFGQWLAPTRHTVHLLGASIGAWRMACAALGDPDADLARMADDYIHQHYPHAPGQPPSARQVSEVFGETLRQRFSGREAGLLANPRYRLHVFTSQGRGLLRREGRWRTPLGYVAAFAANAWDRRALGTWLERAVFSDRRDPLPFSLADFPTRRIDLTVENLASSVLASCSIPFWLKAVHDIPGAPAGAHWDGGITDYHLHLDYASMADGLVLYPHFQPRLVPGWLDKSLKHRHRASARLDNVVVLAPSAEWVAALPGGKLPDRNDFKYYGDDLVGRVRAWSAAVDCSRQLVDDFVRMIEQPTLEALPLL
jgi:hypothetical protein